MLSVGLGYANVAFACHIHSQRDSIPNVQSNKLNKSNAVCLKRSSTVLPINICLLSIYFSIHMF